MTRRSVRCAGCDQPFERGQKLQLMASQVDERGMRGSTSRTLWLCNRCMGRAVARYHIAHRLIDEASPEVPR